MTRFILIPILVLLGLATCAVFPARAGRGHFVCVRLGRPHRHADSDHANSATIPKLLKTYRRRGSKPVVKY